MRVGGSASRDDHLTQKNRSSRTVLEKYFCIFYESVIAVSE